jgi:YbbR domain-containing protein
MTGNMHLKLIALVLSLFVWLYVSSGDKQIDKLIPIPLEIQGQPEDLALVTGVPDQVELYASGPLSRIRQLEDAKEEGVLKAVLDLRRGVEGRKSYPIRVTGANLRWLYRKTHPGPRLEVELEKYAETTAVPERLIIGDLEPGTYIESESGLPERVTVRGAASLVAQLNRVVYRLTEADLVGYENIKVVFIPQDASGRHLINLAVIPPYAEISIAVRKAGAERDVPVVYNLVGSPPPGYTVTDVNFDPLFITLEGPPEVLKEITHIDTEPIDLNGRSDNFTIPTLRLVQPEERVKMSRSTVILEVKIAHKTAQRRFEGLPITWDGGDELVLFYSSEPRTVSVTVSGPIAAVNNLERDKVIPLVNVRGLAEGLHEDRPVTVQITVPEISIVKVEPELVMVRITPRQEFAVEGEDE